MPRELAAFGAAVRDLRKKAGMSQERLAEESSLHRTYISGVERGERNLGLINVYRIARALRVSGPDLLAAAEATRRKRGPSS